MTTITATTHSEGCGDTRREGVGPLCSIACPQRDREPAPQAPRVLARITEEDDSRYVLRCESGCRSGRYGCTLADEYATLQNAARDARSHAISTGHAVLVEAL